jgi:TatD DNase family protein
MYIDAHNHLDFYEEKIAEAIDCINKNNILTLACSMDTKSYMKNKEICKKSNLIIPTFGIHPNNANNYGDCLEKLDEYIIETPIIGEIGLDFHWIEDKSTYSNQIKVFEYFLKKAKQYDKVINVHTKGAEKEIVNLLRKYDVGNNAIIHWYSGNINILNMLIDMGCYFTVSVDIPYCKLTQEIVKYIPIDKLLAETDGPTALEWVNGQYAMPSYIKNVYYDISRVKKIDENELKAQIKNNFVKLVKNLQITSLL